MINREIGQRFEASLAGSSQKLEQKEENTDYSFGDALAEKETNTDKKERLISAEVNGNSGSVEANRNIRMTPRQEALEKIKEKKHTSM